MRIWKMNNKKFYLSRLFLLSNILLLSACNDDMSDLKQYVAKVKARPAGIVEPIPELTPYRNFVYPQNDKDPFDSTELRPKTKQVVFEKGIDLDRSRVPEFLEGFPLDSFTMVGTVDRAKTTWGLIKIPDGTVHRVKAGDYIGQNNGKITLIKEGAIELKEIVSNGMGGYKERDNSIGLSDVTK